MVAVRRSHTASDGNLRFPARFSCHGLPFFPLESLGVALCSTQCCVQLRSIALALRTILLSTSLSTNRIQHLAGPRFRRQLAHQCFGNHCEDGQLAAHVAHEHDRLVRALLDGRLHRWGQDLGVVAASPRLDHAHEGVPGARCGLLAQLLAILLGLALELLGLGLAYLQQPLRHAIELRHDVGLHQQGHFLVLGDSPPQVRDALVKLQARTHGLDAVQIHAKALCLQRCFHCRLGSCDSNYSADAFGNAFLLEKHKFVDLLAVGHVSPATELDTVLQSPWGLLVAEQIVDLWTDADNSNGVRVGLAKDRSEAADCLCRVQGDITVVDNAGFLDKLIANIFDLPELILLHLLVVGEVESKLVLRDQGPLLVDLLAQDLAKRIVQDVGGGVVLCHQRPSRVVHLDCGTVADFQVPLALHLANMQDIAGILLRVVHCKVDTVAGDGRLVENLATLLCIERGPVQDKAHHVGAAVAALHKVLAVIDRLNLRTVLISIALCDPIVFQVVICRLQLHSVDQLVGLVRFESHVLAGSR
mmetsp:Transcript_81913/g.196407  ORF Transcript_81913/g.196407 Transcript_81913/m.196407 type:complete len:531 (+) Transcript_81913:32-1624(+)